MGNKLWQSQAEVTRMGVRTEIVRANVASQDEVREMITFALDRFGSIDSLVNNTGIVRDKTLLKVFAHQWHDVINTDLHGVYYCCREVALHMRERCYGDAL
jgi:NAD(P)-dependent dehydrogenase (short-subunit alcohol dehydrogenase family)